MKLFEQLEKVVEHDLTDFHEDFPFYTSQMFFSYLSPAHARILNEFTNRAHWQEQDNRFKQLLFHKVLPKAKYHYHTFSNYERVSIKPDEKVEMRINYVKAVFDISRAEAINYLKNEKLVQAVDENLDN